MSQDTLDVWQGEICDLLRSAGAGGSTTKDITAHLRKHEPELTADTSRIGMNLMRALRALSLKGRAVKVGNRWYHKNNVPPETAGYQSRAGSGHEYRNPQSVSVITRDGAKVTYQNAGKVIIVIGIIVLILRLIG